MINCHTSIIGNKVSFTYLFNTLSTIYTDCDTLDVGRLFKIGLHLFLFIYSSCVYIICCIKSKDK